MQNQELLGFPSEMQGVQVYREQVGTGYYGFLLAQQPGFCGRSAVLWRKYP